MITAPTPPKREPRAPWAAPRIRTLNAADAELGLRPINPEGQALGS